ncbi:hypothetical protein D9M68_192140 [compost metagenome]
MHHFFVDRENLKASAGYLIDMQRVLDDMDLEVVQELIRARLREIYGPHERTGVFIFDAVCVWGPLYCLPYRMPGEDKSHVALNLFFRFSTPDVSGRDFEPL